MAFTVSRSGCCVGAHRWCEHDPLIIWGSVQRCIESAVEKATAAAGSPIKVRGAHGAWGAACSAAGCMLNRGQHLWVSQ